MYKNYKQPTNSLRKVYFHSVTFEQGCRHSELIKLSANEGGQWTHFLIELPEILIDLTRVFGIGTYLIM